MLRGLARWVHPERGPVSPAIFIRVAEEMGLIGEVTDFVLRRACRDCLTWPEPMAVSVNLAANDLRNPAFSAQVLAVLKETGLPASRLHLEVTEGGFIEDPGKVRCCPSGIAGARRDHLPSMISARAIPASAISIRCRWTS